MNVYLKAYKIKSEIILVHKKNHGESYAFYLTPPPITITVHP